MAPFVLRSLAGEKGRLASGIAGVAFSVLLVLFLFGVYFGFLRSVTEFVDDADADVWVTQAGNADMFHSLSILPMGLGENLSRVPGVAAVEPLYARALHVHVGSQESTLFVVGFDPDSGVGGPGRVAEGRLDLEGAEIVVSQVFARDQGVGLGDRVHVGDRDFEIVGLTDQTSASLFTYAFIHRDVAAEALAAGAGVVQYFLVTASPGVEPTALARRIANAEPAVEAETSAEFADRNAAGVKETFDPILLSVAAMGLVISVAVVGLGAFSAVAQRIGEFGVLKAMGAPMGLLYRLVAVQAAVAALAGFALGWPLYYAVSAAVSRFVPRIPFDEDPATVAGVFLAVTLSAVAASLLPLARIRRIDPVDVLRRA